MRPDDPVDHSDQRGNEGTLRFEVAIPPAPINLRIERAERAFVEIARHGDGIELPPGMRVGERSGEVEKAKAGGERQDQQEREAIPIAPSAWLERTDA